MKKNKTRKNDEKPLRNLSNNGLTSYSIYWPGFWLDFGQIFGQGFDQGFGERKHLEYSVQYYPSQAKHLENHKKRFKALKL